MGPAEPFGSIAGWDVPNREALWADLDGPRSSPFGNGAACCAVALFGAMLVQEPASAQSGDWSREVFAERLHEFGTVARGSTLRHSFPVTNRTDREVRITGWKPKCGCTEVAVGAKVIPPGAQTTIEAVLDTTKYRDYKASGVTVYTDQPSALAIDLDLTCFIQDEVVFNPGMVDFGEVKRGTNLQVVVAIRYQGGQNGWRIVDSTHANQALSATIQEESRSATGAVQYRLTATLDLSALKNGNYRDQIELETNDPQRPKIPLSVAARVSSDVSLSPSVLNLGTLRAGEAVERTILVRGTSPFKVEGASAVEGSIAMVGDPGAEAKQVQQVKVRIEAPSHSGAYHAILEIRTDRPDEPPARLTAFATGRRLSVCSERLRPVKWGLAPGVFGRCQSPFHRAPCGPRTGTGSESARCLSPFSSRTGHFGTHHGRDSRCPPRSPPAPRRPPPRPPSAWRSPT